MRVVSWSPSPLPFSCPASPAPRGVKQPRTCFRVSECTQVYPRSLSPAIQLTKGTLLPRTRVSSHPDPASPLAASRRTITACSALGIELVLGGPASFVSMTGTASRRGKVVEMARACGRLGGARAGRREGRRAVASAARAERRTSIVARLDVGRKGGEQRDRKSVV